MFNAAIKITTKVLMKTERRNFPLSTHFLTVIPISLFYCCEKVFIHINTLMIEENPLKHNYLKKNYSLLNMKDIPDEAYMHKKRVCKEFKIKKWVDDYYHLYVQAVFENIWNVCLEIYELDHGGFLTASRLV